MRVSLRFSASACLLACSQLVSATACTKRPDRIVVGTVLVNVPPDLDAGGLRERLRALARELAEGTPAVSMGEPATHRCIVEVGGLADERNRTLQLVAVALRSTHGGVDFETVGMAPALSEDPMVGAVQDGWRVLQEQRRLHVAVTEELVRALRHEDKRLRMFAIAQLGERRAPEAVDALGALLTDERAVDEALRVVGALVSIGDERAVAPLIELTRRKPPGFVRQIVFAVASIGGGLAEGFLVTLASGHSDPIVQRDASDALAELKRR